MSNAESRKWLITINNPIDKGYSHSCIKELLKNMKSVQYWCMSDEIGEEGTYHTHLFICCGSNIRFSTIDKKFHGGNFQTARGTCQENRDYVYKEGKWEHDEKRQTNISDTHEEWGVMPVERQGKRNDLIQLYAMIKEGLSNYEIIEACPKHMLKIDHVERTRQMVREEKYKGVFREIQTVYIYGDTGTGKTRGVMEEYGYENVYRITDYDHPFDGYKGQDIVIFEEFRSSLKIQDMLNYLDGYPLTLPCRYTNKVACFTKVFIITNIELEEQYKGVPRPTRDAFIRRIHKIKKYSVGSVVEKTMEEYNKEKEAKFLEGLFKDTKK